MNQRNSSNVAIYLYLGVWDIIIPFGPIGSKRLKKPYV